MFQKPRKKKSLKKTPTDKNIDIYKKNSVFYNSDLTDASLNLNGDLDVWNCSTTIHISKLLIFILF